MPSTWSREQASWSDRIARAAELRQRNSWAGEVLGFYRQILQFQQAIYERLQLPNDRQLTTETGLLGAVDLDDAERSFPALVDLVQAHGPARLAEEGRRLRDLPRPEVRIRFQRCLATADPPQDVDLFFVRVLFEPQAERLARARVGESNRTAGNRCPQCGSKPQFAVIRPEGDGGKRMLGCSFCQSEWEFRRILCPVCGEEHNENLPRYSAEGISAVRVEGCDTCKSYLKSVDLTVDGLAVPAVDEIATAPLDLWAAEHDYRKIQPNIMGF